MSIIAQKMAGTFLPEVEKPPVLQWFQEQLRSGALKAAVERFVRESPEALNAARIQVDEVTETVVRCHIPRFVADHESSRPMRDDVAFDLDPLRGTILRRNS